MNERISDGVLSDKIDLLECESERMINGIIKYIKAKSIFPSEHDMLFSSVFSDPQCKGLILTYLRWQ